MRRLGGSGDRKVGGGNGRVGRRKWAWARSPKQGAGGWTAAGDSATG